MKGVLSMKNRLISLVTSVCLIISYVFVPQTEIFNTITASAAGCDYVHLWISKVEYGDEYNGPFYPGETYYANWEVKYVNDTNSKVTIDLLWAAQYPDGSRPLQNKESFTIGKTIGVTSDDGTWKRGRMIVQVTQCGNYICAVGGKLSTDSKYLSTNCSFNTTHKFSSAWTTDKAATCTSNGSKSHHCLGTNCSQKSNVTTISASGHSYDSWTTTKLATCTETGTKKRRCTRSGCNNYETQTIAKLGHNFSDRVVAPTSTEKGYILHTCTRCDYSYKDNYTDALGIDLLGCTVTLGTSSYTYDGTAKKPSVTVRDGTKTLTNGNVESAKGRGLKKGKRITV